MRDTQKLYDIAVSKFYAITSNPKGRDYRDLYNILQENNWSIQMIREKSAIKYGIHVETIYLAGLFLRVIEFEDLPKMLVPFDRKKMEKFFLNEAKKLKKEILK